MERQPEPELMDLPDEASVYASAPSGHIMDAFVQRLLGFVGERENLNVVDLGTGPGSIPILIARSRPSWRITAVDAAEAMLLIAQADIVASNLADRVTAHLADVK